MKCLERPACPPAHCVSLPVRGAWVEITTTARCSAFSCASLPVRGAWVEIFLWPFSAFRGVRSLPVRGAWVEMRLHKVGRKPDWSLPVRGAWVEICPLFQRNGDDDGRSPCGERGLK